MKSVTTKGKKYEYNYTTVSIHLNPKNDHDKFLIEYIKEYSKSNQKSMSKSLRDILLSKINNDSQ